MAPCIKSVWKDLDAELDQIWAEAVMRWRLGEQLFLVGDIEQEAKAEQESHRETSSKEGIILDFIEALAPDEWPIWNLDKLRMFLNGTTVGEVRLVPRDRICALEVWCEAFGGSSKDLRYGEAVEIKVVNVPMLDTIKSYVALAIKTVQKQQAYFTGSMPNDICQCSLLP